VQIDHSWMARERTDLLDMPSSSRVNSSRRSAPCACRPDLARFGDTELGFVGAYFPAGGQGARKRRCGRSSRRDPGAEGRPEPDALRSDEHVHRGAAQADFVRNIDREPRVRPLVNRRWRTATARLMPDDDPDQRSACCLPVGRGSRPHDRHLPADHPYRSRTRPRVELSHPVGPAGVSGPGERRAAGGSPAADDRVRTLARAAARLRCVSNAPRRAKERLCYLVSNR
jgi:hypothetical protein